MICSCYGGSFHSSPVLDTLFLLGYLLHVQAVPLCLLMVPLFLEKVRKLGTMVAAFPQFELFHRQSLNPVDLVVPTDFFKRWWGELGWHRWLSI